jgi:hypothetical protein
MLSNNLANKAETPKSTDHGRVTVGYIAISSLAALSAATTPVRGKAGLE